MTNDDRLKERREGAALATERLAQARLDGYCLLRIAREYRAGIWDADLSKGLETKGVEG